MTIPKYIVKKFRAWTKKKIFHHVQERTKELYYYEGQVWWAALGKNIGFEMDGKHELFHRPVLILKKYNKDMCFVAPLTTQIKKITVWYQIPISFDMKPSVVNISQARTISTKRLLRKITAIESEDFKKVVCAFIRQFK